MILSGIACLLVWRHPTLQNLAVHKQPEVLQDAAMERGKMPLTVTSPSRRLRAPNAK